MVQRLQGLPGNFSLKLGNLLKRIRKERGLTQTELGVRLGFSSKSARIYISRLERGNIKNPSLWLILNYLTECEKSWSAFFGDLAGVYFSEKSDEVSKEISNFKVKMDAIRYFHRLYSYPPQKPLPTYQKEAMVKKFAQYRADLEVLERKVTILLGDSEEPLIRNQFYKAYLRQCVRAIKKYYPTSEQELTSQLNEIMQKWQDKGLNEKYLVEIRNLALRYFIKPEMK
jgi:transcriptional regulator with XRE-family HTH domain